MPPTTFPGATYFVRRNDPTADILGRLAAAGVWVHDLEGIQGSGKTMFLSHLFRGITETSVALPAWVSLRAIHPGRDSDEPVEGLERDFYAFCEILAGFATDLGITEFVQHVKTIREAIADIPARTVVIQQNIKVGILARIEKSTFHWGPVDISDQDQPADFVRRIVDRARLSVGEDFVSLVNDLSQRRRPVLFADDFERVHASRIGDWFLALISQLNDAIVVIARGESLRALGDVSGVVIGLKLENFDADEISRFLRDQLNRAEPPAGLADRILSITGGHPEAVYVATQLARQYGADRPDLLSVFDDLHGEARFRLGTLVERLVQEIADTDILRAVEVASVLRRFDVPILNYMLERDEDDRPLIADLLQFAFTEEHQQAETGKPYYRFHDFIRAEQDERLARTKPELYEKLHTRAATYYSAWLSQCEDEDRDPAAYCRAYRYEGAEWQDMVSEWLYHLSRIDPRQARLELARVYFAAFWWWGCYLEFPFCERLLRVGEVADSRPEMKEVLALLRQFHSAYPPETSKDRSQEDWLKVEDTLAELARLERGTTEVPDEDAAERRRQLQAYLRVFTAHALRGQDAPIDAIEGAYEDAQALFAESEELSWSVPWTLYERADVALARGDLPRAAEQAHSALELVLPELLEKRDNEVTANAYRVLGDVAWTRNDTEEAVANFELSALYAYAFQAFPKAADYYTITFFAQTAEHILERIRQLAERVPAEQISAVLESMHGFWSEYWRRAGDTSRTTDIATLLSTAEAHALARYVLPAFPTTDAAEPGSEYVMRARAVAERTLRGFAKGA